MTTIEKAISGELVDIKIPPRPAILLNVQREMRADEPDFLAIEEIISLDVAISASLIKVANSPVLGLGRPTRSIQEALQVLGLNRVTAVISAIVLRHSFGKGPNLERFWDSSARIAQLTGWLAGRIEFTDGKIKQDEAFTFGLFRDCGIPVLMSMYADYLDILKIANQETERPFTAIEIEELDLDHTMIGAMLIREWELPTEFSAAIANHHDPDALQATTPEHMPTAARRLVALAQLAEFLFQTLTGLNKTCEWDKLGANCLPILQLNPEQLETLAEQAKMDQVHLHPIL